MTMVLRVRSVRAVTPAARLLRLSLDDLGLVYRPGQALCLGRPGQPTRRPYAIANAPEEARASGYLEFLLGTRSDGRLGRHLSGLRRGIRLEASGPVGSSLLPRRLTTRHLVLVAGGTGIAPLRAIWRYALASGYRGRITVVYSARTPRHFAYLRELRRLVRENRVRLYATATRAAPRGWRGARGRLTQDQLRALVRDRSAWCVVCGPPGFVRDVVAHLRRLGIPRRQIRTGG
jgi:NAD(P)H-flavin reductase